MKKLNKTLPGDYSPKSAREKQFYQNADNVYIFIKEIYIAYGRMRFRGVPFMKEPAAEFASLDEESIAEHMWATGIFWMVISPLTPSLTRLVDSKDV